MPLGYNSVNYCAVCITDSVGFKTLGFYSGSS